MPQTVQWPSSLRSLQAFPRGKFERLHQTFGDFLRTLPDQARRVHAVLHGVRVARLTRDERLLVSLLVNRRDSARTVGRVLDYSG